MARSSHAHAAAGRWTRWPSRLLPCSLSLSFPPSLPPFLPPSLSLSLRLWVQVLELIAERGEEGLLQSEVCPALGFDFKWLPALVRPLAMHQAPPALSRSH